MNIGLTDTHVLALVIEPAAPASLYVGTKSRVFKTTNGGEYWSEIDAGLVNTFVAALAIDPSMPSTLYAGVVGGVISIPLVEP
jgi:hypothetical protein